MTKEQLHQKIQELKKQYNLKHTPPRKEKLTDRLEPRNQR